MSGQCMCTYIRHTVFQKLVMERTIMEAKANGLKAAKQSGSLDVCAVNDSDDIALRR